VPALTAVLLALAVGGLLAWVAPRARSLEAVWAPTKLVTSFGVLLVAPGVSFVALAAPDWSYGYHFASGAVPSAVGLVVGAAAGATVSAGFFWVARARVAGRAAVAGWFFPLTLLAAVLSLQPHRALLRDGPTAQVLQGFASRSLGGALGAELVWVAGFVALAGTVVARALSKGESAALGVAPRRRLGSRDGDDGLT
jgi:hypothetical protein